MDAYNRGMQLNRWPSYIGLMTGLFCLGCVSQPEEKPASPPVVEPAQPARTDFLNPDKIIFASTPYLGEGFLKDEFQPLVDYLAEKLGRPCELRSVASYEKMIELIGTQEVHLGVLSPLSYVRAKKAEPDLHLLASQVANGATTYSAYIVSRNDIGIESLIDLKGKRFGFVDKLSTSGYLYPMAEMRSLKIVPDKFFSEILYAGDHEKLIEWVLAGKVDAGATSSSAFNIMKDQAPGNEKLSIIAKMGRIPYDAVVANARLEPSLVAKAREAILGLNTQDELGRQVLRGPTNINGFVPASDNLYTDVRRALTSFEQ
ncbi:MAG: phosphate/phosphite/phosphonate ABC transporter substrate-binding protein [Deltaproteobacteria bacterium]|jgi:phosphate/phosphite/phosphonate ABC transporter binding protein|nr:phosphate/phosphite/phosphonate ABC transporter substrate-binding protein [Deltaproteobacteria bacterium]MBT6435606.1 phosphate/phosphite/phosphonate ABC transporter substrate-binding protein [Deltaproteobacteria bacterium]MBT6489234.1 phosphate/phosphite/phosphonate ABC transporter substrate-binding protein [Deltaproteobacteria bacterium]